MYEFKEAEKVEPAPAQAPERPQVKANPPGTVIQGEDPKAEAPKEPILYEKEMIGKLLSEIKNARPKAGLGALQAFKKFYENNRGLIIGLTGPDFDYCKGKWSNAGLSWENDFLGANPAQVETSPPEQTKAPDKPQSSSIVDFGDGQGEEPPPVDTGEPDPRTMLRHKIKLIASELKPGSWEALVNYFRGWESEAVTVEFLQGMLKRVQSSLDKQNAG